MSEQILPPTRPEDCVLAIAVPLNREEFEERWRKASDYLHSISKSHEIEDAWTNYEFLIKKLPGILKRVRELGVHVETQLSHERWHQLISQFDVITLVGHWVGARFLEHQILRKEELSTWISRQDVGHDLSQGLAQVVNQQVHGQMEEQVDEGALGMQSPFLCREKWDEEHPGWMVPGNRLELWDGYFSVSQMTADFPEGFSKVKVFDLSCCHAVHLGECIKRSDNAIVHMARIKAEPRTRLVFYGQLVRYLAGRAKKEQPISYSHAAMQLRMCLAQKFTQQV